MISPWTIAKGIVSGKAVVRKYPYLDGFGIVPIERVVELLPWAEDLAPLGAPRVVVLGRHMVGRWEDGDPAGVQEAVACLRRVRGDVPERWRAVTSEPRQVFILAFLQVDAEILRRVRCA